MIDPVTEQIIKDEQLRRQMLDPVTEQIIKNEQSLTESLKPLQDALRGGEEMRKLGKQIQDAIGGTEEKLTKQMQDAIGGSSSRLTDIIRSTTMMPTFPDLSNVRTVGDHVQELIHAQAESAEASTARRAVLHLEEQIREFETEIDDASDVGIKLVSFGQTMVVHIETISHMQPNLIVFVGNLDDEVGPRVRLVQHMSQLSFLLVGLPRLEPEKPRRPIGFTTSEEEPDAK